MKNHSLKSVKQLILVSNFQIKIKQIILNLMNTLKSYEYCVTYLNNFVSSSYGKKITRLET